MFPEGWNEKIGLIAEALIGLGAVATALLDDDLNAAYAALLAVFGLFGVADAQVKFGRRRFMEKQAVEARQVAEQATAMMAQAMRRPG